MTSLAIQDQTFSQLKRMARLHNISPDALAERAIREFLRADARRMMQREVEAFREQHAQLLETYPGEFVAISEGKVVDHDLDQLALFTRIDERFPDRPVLVTKVSAMPEEVYTVWSPQIEGEYKP